MPKTTRLTQGDIDGLSLHAAVRCGANERQALVPRPRLHLIRLHGVLTPNAKLLKGPENLPDKQQISLRELLLKHFRAKKQFSSDDLLRSSVS